MESTSITGGCSCGAVRFHGAHPPLFCVHCHCPYCRKAHGAAFVTWLGLREEGFGYDAGEATVTWYASSKQGRRGFCSRCGTTVFFASTLAPGEIHVALACVDEPHEHEPTAHVFEDQRAAWYRGHDDLRRVATDSKALAKYSAVEPSSR